jgi:hypothetical protein
VTTSTTTDAASRRGPNMAVAITSVASTDVTSNSMSPRSAPMYPP